MTLVMIDSSVKDGCQQNPKNSYKLQNMTVIDDNVLHYYKLCTEEQVSTSKMLQF